MGAEDSAFSLSAGRSPPLPPPLAALFRWLWMKGESPHPNLIGASHHTQHSRRAFCNRLTSESRVVWTSMLSFTVLCAFRESWLGLWVSVCRTHGDVGLEFMWMKSKITYLHLSPFSSKRQSMSPRANTWNIYSGSRTASSPASTRSRWTEKKHLLFVCLWAIT